VGHVAQKNRRPGRTSGYPSFKVEIPAIETWERTLVIAQLNSSQRKISDPRGWGVRFRRRTKGVKPDNPSSPCPSQKKKPKKKRTTLVMGFSRRLGKRGDPAK